MEMNEGFDVLMAFREGGWTMWVILLLTLLALPLASIALMTGNRVLAFAGMALAALIGLTGVGGMMLGRHMTDRAVAVVSPEQRAMIVEVGHREAGRNLYFAGIVGVPLMLLSVAAFARAMQKQDVSESGR